MVAFAPDLRRRSKVRSRQATGRKEAEIVREALAQYLGQTDPASVKGAISDLQDRVANVERKLASLGRLVG